MDYFTVYTNGRADLLTMRELLDADLVGFPERDVPEDVLAAIDDQTASDLTRYGIQL